MSPALIRLNDLKPGELSTPPVSHGANAMHGQFTLYRRSANDGGSGGVQANTIIFIVVGVVCLFVILAGFYFVSRSHAASKAAAASVPSPHGKDSPHSHIIHPPGLQRKGNKIEFWKFWKSWRHTGSPELPTVAEIPSSPVSAAPISPPSPMIPARALTYPSITSRPSQARRVTSLSVTTSFSNSHITQEALNDFRLSAYDLDGDLETEMLNSARDDIWPGLPLAVGEYCGEMSIQESDVEARGNAAHCHQSVDGSVQAYVPLIQRKGSDYENSGACQITVSCVEGDVVRIVEESRG